MNVWVRYLFVKEIFLKKKVQDVIKWQRVNIAGIILGFLSALGISMVANFQVISTYVTIEGNWSHFNQTLFYVLIIYQMFKSVKRTCTCMVVRTDPLLYVKFLLIKTEMGG